MGTQIYIYKEALQRVEVVVKYHTETYYGESLADEYSEELANVVGLGMEMYTTIDAVYHDANRYGSSRSVLLEFIEKHQLKAGQDWFEA